MVHPQEPPVLDFSVFYGSDSQAKTKLLQDIRECCLKNGFFQITGHRVSRELQRRTMSCVERFFDLPLEEKLKIDRSRNPFNRGYEVMQSHMSQPGSSPDLKEGLFIGQDLPVHHPYCVEKKFNCGPNVWPEALDDLEEFKCTTMEYYDAVFQLAKDIIAVLALTINGDEGLFAPYTDGAVATLRYLHYPPQPPKTYDNARGCGAHRDYSGITILLQDEVGGLQVLDEPTGQWIDIKPTPGAYVINLANLFSRMTNEIYKSALHRVINKTGLERYSIPFFFTGNPNYICKCLSEFQQEGEPAKYPPATVSDIVGAAMRGTVERAKLFNAKK